jgi:membrane protease YdiL (CAAX protease family)
LNSSTEYWNETRRPLNCLLFLLPLVIIYEVGVYRLGGDRPETIRNGADYWLRASIPGHSPALTLFLPGLVLLALLAWQIYGKYSWNVSPRACKGMLAESILFAFVLVMLGKVEQSLLLSLEPSSSMNLTRQASVNQAITYIGAGIYEEFLFRLCLLPLVYQALRWSMTPRWATVLAVLGTSLLFSAAHYLGPGGEPFTLFSFVFRTTAGIYFSALFFLRGFGITVGCHASYDILVGILLLGSH